MTNTMVEKMKPKNVIVWILLLGIVVLLMSTSVQAKELTEVNATDILEKIEKGEDISRENVRITGEFNLSKMLKTTTIARSVKEIKYYGLKEELKIVESEIEFHYSVLEDDVHFSNTQFRKFIVFRGTSFLGKKILFRGANFGGYAYFGDANFSGDANFEVANFSNNAKFRDANFGGDAYFGDANFSGDANFEDVDFYGDANFKHVDFGGDANFEDVNFGGDANFEDVNFYGDANFEDVNFGGDANFEDVNFYGKTSFNSTEFNKVSFKGATFTNVSLHESEFNQMKVEWSTLKDALSADGLTYIKLIKNFRELEQFEDADAAYYQYRRLSQASKEWSYSKLMDVVAGASCGYGVKPERPLIWAFCLIMLFTLVYWLGKGIKRLKENDGDKNRVSRWAAFYNAFYFSVVTFTTVGYGDWYPVDRYRIVVMIEGVLGWLLLALFIVTLANVMIRP
jgi:uncharacterized protein YjbI with pentapeptide repeats